MVHGWGAADSLGVEAAKLVIVQRAQAKLW